MAIPRIFVASTCYDLKYIRENLKYFIRSLGYEPVLSEDGAIFYDPEKHTHDSCISEVPNCQMLVLIIGGRFGGKFKDTDKSITNAEYQEALKHKVPIFVLIENAVYAEHHVYLTNKDNKNIDAEKIVYPAVDSPRIFDFIDEVRKASFNNAVQPFRDFSDIESYLKQQWSGLMFSFLAKRNEQSRVADIMARILAMDERMEFLTNQILKSVGSKESNALVRLYDVLLGSEVANTLISTGHRPNPLAILQCKTLEECASNLGKPFKVSTRADYITSSTGEINAKHLEAMETEYANLRKAMLDLVKELGFTVEQLVRSEKEAQKK
jgi:hypothetical protein